MLQAMQMRGMVQRSRLAVWNGRWNLAAIADVKLLRDLPASIALQGSELVNNARHWCGTTGSYRFDTCDPPVGLGNGNHLCVKILQTQHED